MNTGSLWNGDWWKKYHRYIDDYWDDDDFKYVILNHWLKKKAITEEEYGMLSDLPLIEVKHYLRNLQYLDSAFKWWFIDEKRYYRICKLDLIERDLQISLFEEERLEIQIIEWFVTVWKITKQKCEKILKMNPNKREEAINRISWAK